MDLALKEAHEKVDYVLIKEGEYKIDRPIKITNEKFTDCLGIVGENRQKVKIWTDRPQSIDWNPNTNLTDARNDAMILLERVDKKVISAITIEYKGEFYRKAQTYFGCVNGIYLEHRPPLRWDHNGIWLRLKGPCQNPIKWENEQNC